MDKIQNYDFARKFLAWRLYSLYCDIERCLEGYKENYNLPYGLEKYRYSNTAKIYFPALMYCFSVINLLGNLYSGKIGSGSNSINSKNYIKEFMQKKDNVGNIVKYTQDQTNLLWDIFHRHELTHLSMPQTVFEYKSDKITWQLHDVSTMDHLQILPKAGTFTFDGILQPITYNKIFMVDIKTLRDDILESVYGPSKYLETIKANMIANDNFKKAIEIIYSIK